MRVGWLRRRFGPLWWVVVVLVITGCGGDDSEDEPGPDANSEIEPVAAIVFVEDGPVEVPRTTVDEITALLGTEVVARSILFEDESDENVRAIVTRWLVMDAITAALSGAEITGAELDGVRAQQTRQLASELVFFDEADPSGRAGEITSRLRPYLDVVARVGIRRSATPDFDDRVGDIVVILDPTIGAWDPERLAVAR